MQRLKKHKKNTVVVLDQIMLKSAVWIGLKGSAIAVFLLFRTKCQWEKLQGTKHQRRTPDIANNGEIIFTYEEAGKDYGIPASRFKRAIDELITKGFIDVASTGCGAHKATTLYAISQRWQKYGTSDFVIAKRPKRNTGYPGFKKGNTMYERRQKTNTTVVIDHGAMRDNDHGDILTMRTNDHGEREKIIYKWNNNKWLASEVA